MLLMLPQTPTPLTQLLTPPESILIKHTEFHGNAIPQNEDGVRQGIFAK